MIRLKILLLLFIQVISFKCILDSEHLNIILNNSTSITNYTIINNNTINYLEFNNTLYCNDSKIQNEIFKYEKIIIMNEIDDLIKITSKMNMTFYNTILHIIKHNDTYCETTSLSSVKIFCELLKPLTFIREKIKNLIYTEEHLDEKLYDLSESYIGLYHNQFANEYVHNLPKNITFYEVAKGIMPKTLKDIKKLKKTLKNGQHHHDIMKEIPFKLYSNIKHTIMNYDFKPSKNNIDEYLIDLKNTTIIQGIINHYDSGKYIINNINEPILELQKGLKFHIPHLKDHLKLMLHHNIELYNKMDHSNETLFNKILYKSYILSNNQYRTSKTYYYKMNEIHDIKNWEGFHDPHTKIYFNIHDASIIIKYGFCYYTRSSCMNDPVGANPGVPFAVESNGITLFYPQFIPPPPNSELFPGLDLATLNCDAYFNYIVFIKGWSNILTRRWLPHILEWEYFNITSVAEGILYDTVNPIQPDVIPCLIVHTFNFVTISIVGSIVIIIILILFMCCERIERGVRNVKDNETYIPTLTKLNDNLKEGVNDLQNRISSRINNFKKNSNKLFQKTFKWKQQ
jgi:hypothetical protein